MKRSRSGCPSVHQPIRKSLAAVRRRAFFEQLESRVVLDASIYNYNFSAFENTWGNTEQFYISLGMMESAPSNVTAHFSVDNSFNNAGTPAATYGTDYTFGSGVTGSGGSFSIVIPAGSSGVYIPLTILDDAFVEGSEYINLRLTSVSGYNLDPYGETASAQIYDDESSSTNPTASIVASSGPATEAGPVDGTFNIHLTNGGATYPFTLSYSVTGTATNGSDFTTLSGTVYFDTGETDKPLTVHPVNDLIQESTETVMVTITRGGSMYGYNISESQREATIAIFDDDSPPPVPSVSVAVNDSTCAEASSDNSVFRISRGSAEVTPLTVHYSIATGAGQANNGTDYGALTGTAIIPANWSYVDVVVDPVDDEIYEPGGETVQLTLSADAAYTLVNPTSRTITIADNDAAPNISIGNWTGNEPGNAIFTVTLTRESNQLTTVAYATAQGTATSSTPKDYTATNGTLQIPAGQLTGTISVAIEPDTTDEVDETFNVNLSSPSGGTIIDGVGLGTIIDNDGPVISVNSVSATEAGSMTFTISLDQASPQSVSVNYETSSVTATSGVDFTAVDDEVTFEPGERFKYITVQTTHDTLDENDETFNFVLLNPFRGTLGASTGVGTILDDDPLPSLSISGATVSESQTSVTLTVTLTPKSGRPVSVAYNTSNLTATAGSDYTAKNGTLNFAPDDDSEDITLQLSNDTKDEDDEQFRVALSNAVAATIGTAQASVTIQDNDRPRRSTSGTANSARMGAICSSP
jgi:hypothetical protein